MSVSAKAGIPSKPAAPKKRFPSGTARPRPAPKAKTEPSVVSGTPLGARLRAIRERYIAGGGKLLTLEEIDHETSTRRGQRNAEA